MDEAVSVVADLLAYADGPKLPAALSHLRTDAPDPNTHLAIGYGVHFCLGAALARMEVDSFCTDLLSRVKSIELTGTPEFTATTADGLTHLPVRYQSR